ncbi:hypothetical protein CLV30_12629 [Haloactinopolyspora alba]|uniref:Uncharacterized protein n=1 Tax=Haloactinopolyspora alba TaxID=648780 RepID=A0A2P8DGL7_9ACTN|nr:hypothetical protein [Haloactinopolyspora alba]PSK96370.1 hypothetical protein CLV30_12629 [Haloactinopolyspora alba]
MYGYDGQTSQDKQRKGRHRGAPMSLLQQLRAGRGTRRPVVGERTPGVRRARRQQHP